MKFRVMVLAPFLAVALSPFSALAKGKLPEQEYQEEYVAQEKEAERSKSSHPEEAEPSAKPKSRDPLAPVEEASPEISPEEEEEAEETSQEPVPPQTMVQEMNAQVPPGAIVHTVWIWQESKDCLWVLAKKYYKDPWQWKKIYIENRNTILNPNVIFPKQKIVIPSLQASAQ